MSQKCVGLCMYYPAFASVVVSNLHWQFACYQIKCALITHIWASILSTEPFPLYSLFCYYNHISLYLCSCKIYHGLLDTRSLQVVQQKPMRSSMTTRKHSGFKPTLTACSATAKILPKGKYILLPLTACYSLWLYKHELPFSHAQLADYLLS